MRRNKLMTAILSSLRSVPVFPVGAEKPLAIRRSTKEVVETSREGVVADRNAVQVLQEEHGNEPADNSFVTSASTAIEARSFDGQQNRASLSVDSRGSFGGYGRSQNVGLRRTSLRPEGLE